LSKVTTSTRRSGSGGASVAAAATITVHNRHKAQAHWRHHGLAELNIVFMDGMISRQVRVAAAPGTDL
jgi:hypothetical protein